MNLTCQQFFLVLRY